MSTPTRNTTRTAMQWLLEPENGVYATRPGMASFDIDIVDYQHDAKKALLSALTEKEYALLVLIYRDGMPAAQATRLLGVEAGRPDNLVRSIETKAGVALEMFGVGSPSEYLSKG